MKKPRDKRAIVFMMLFILAVIFYIVSDAILQSNTLSAAKSSKASEYGQLVNWLPDKAKLADGGTVIYKAILYEVTFFHRCSIVQGTIEGTKIVILGKEIYNDSGLDY